MMNAASLMALAGRIREAYARTGQARLEWIEGTLELASALAEARSQFPADQHFAGWLNQNGFDGLGKNDRTALINMATDLDLARTVLQDTQRHSWRHIWEAEMHPRFPHVGKPADEATNSLPPPPRTPPAKPDYLTVTAEEREQAKAEAERKQQAAWSAFEADRAARRRMQEAQDANAEAAGNYDALIAAWETCTEEEQQRFLRDHLTAPGGSGQ